MDFSATDTLSSCTKLTMLTLDRNPITKSPNYHSVISTLIPTLTLLDGHAVQSTGTTPQASYSMILDAVSSMKLMEEELEDERRMEMEIMGLDDTEDRTQGIYGFHSGSMVSAGSGSGSVGNSMNMRSSVNSIGSHGGGVGANADTGSELTYGSNNAVLAGSMASALRQRRNTNNGNGNNNSNPAAATTVSQELDIAMSQSMAPNKHSASHSVESKSSSEKSQSSSAAVSGKGANPNKQQFPEELQRNSASDSKSESRMVYMEGDVTKLLTAQCEDLESSDDEVFQRPSRMGRGSGSGLGCGAGGKSKIPTANRDRTRMDGSVGALLDADSRGSAKGLSRENSGIDMSGRPPSAGIRKAPSPTARSLQRGNSFSKQNGSRPGSASRPGSNSSFASSRPDSGLSDRPGSAAIYASFKDTDMSINAPFKISAASSDTRKPMGSTMEENPETQVDTTAWALDRIAVDSDSKPSLLSLYSNSSTSLSSAWHRKDKNAKRDPKGACKSGDNSDDEGHYYYTHNTRGMRRKSRNCQPDSDDESEEESIAVTHASRHQMMTRSGSRRKITPVTLGDALSGKTTSIPSCASPQQVPSGDTISPLGEGHGVDDGASISLSASASANNSPSKEGNPHEFASPIATTPPAAFSSTVIPNSHEKSLGIGSGADTGVRTKRTFNRDSDGDSDDDVPIFGSNSGARSTSAMASLSLGFDLKNSLAAINQWVNDESESAENNNSDDSGREKKADGVRSNKIVDKHEFDQRKVEADSESDSDTPIATHIRSVGERVKVTSKLNISISGEPRVSGPGSGVGSKSKGQGGDNVLIGSMSEAEDDYGSNMDQLDDWGYDYGGFVGSNSKPNSVSKSKSKCKAPSVQQAFVTVDNKQGQSKQTIRERMDRLGNGGGAAVHSTRDYLTSDPQYLTKKSQNVMKTASVPGKGTVVRDPYDDSDSDSDLDGCVGMGGGGSSSVPLSRAELKSMVSACTTIRYN